MNLHCQSLTAMTHHKALCMHTHTPTTAQCPADALSDTLPHVLLSHCRVHQGDEPAVDGPQVREAAPTTEGVAPPPTPNPPPQHASRSNTSWGPRPSWDSSPPHALWPSPAPSTSSKAPSLGPCTSTRATCRGCHASIAWWIGWDGEEWRARCGGG